MTVLHALINNLLGGQILCGIIHILGIAFEVTAYRYFNVPFPPGGYVLKIDVATGQCDFH